MKTPIQSVGEAMPKAKTRLGRRTFLKGAAIIAAATPAAAMEPPARANVANLVAYYYQEREAANEADEAAYRLYMDPARPEWPTVEAKEFRPIHFLMRERQFNTPDQINEVIDNHMAERRRHYGWVAEGCEGGCLTPALQDALDRYLQQAEDERAKLLSAWGERKALYEAWNISSGHKAADEESDRRWRSVLAIKDEIFEWPCETIDDLRTKAGYLAKEYGNELDPDKAHAFIAEVAAFGRAVA